jgi:glycine reductase
MSAELERAGLPTAMITALGPVALDLGANRVVRGVKIPHPCGDPTLEPAKDRALRLALVRTSLRALGTKLDAATIISAESAQPAAATP